MNATYITFEELTPAPATKRWAVMSKDQRAQIGMVKWYGPWRKYCFFPMGNTVFEWVCLSEIADFCEAQTLVHRQAKTPAPQTPPPAAEPRPASADEIDKDSLLP